MSVLSNEKNDVVMVGDEKFVPLYTKDEIRLRITELASEISREYVGKVPIFIGVLNGSFIFLSDLIKEVSLDCEIDFFKLSSYGDEKISSGNVTLLKELNCDVNGRDIII
ncbi:MAG: hypoxanthine phosphoribosyltransferase, partial [Ignavibacteriaceae bacterium]|nr:hypoxanthine phosphoribosyltransferase [Ignavibacteriaceae bacterium]